MTKEDIDVKSKLESIMWAAYKINHETNSAVNFTITKSQISVLFFDSTESRSPLYTFLINCDDPRTIQKLTDCEKRLLFELRCSNQNTRRTI